MFYHDLKKEQTDVLHSLGKRARLQNEYLRECDYYDVRIVGYPSEPGYEDRVRRVVAHWEA